MPNTGDVTINVTDGAAGAVTVPSSSIQVVMGCCSAGTANQLVVTRSPATLQSTCGYGPGVEAAALACKAGGTVIFCKLPPAATGTATAVIKTGTGTSTWTVTLDGTNGAFDDYYVQVNVLTGGTQGSTGMSFQISLDAGRNFGPIISITTATSYIIANTGITLNFAAGTFVAGDVFRFSTTAPAWNTAGVQAAINALQASAYANTGWGSMHLVGVCSGANSSTIEAMLDTLATGYVFTRLFLSARDAIAPTKWGGAGETEATWVAAIQADFAAASNKRECCGAGYWNIPTAYPTAVAGAPRYRRSMTWAAAARQVTVPPQRHIGRVRDGALAQIVVDPTNDPQDGFVYHDERINPGLDYIVTGTGGRFMSTRTRIGKPGVFVTNPTTLAPLGSDFYILPFGQVIDIACSIIHQVGQDDINADVRLNTNGTIYENDALAIERNMMNAINNNMTAFQMISGVTVALDRTINVQATKSVSVTVTITGRGYILSETVNIGLSNPNAS